MNRHRKMEIIIIFLWFYIKKALFLRVKAMLLAETWISLIIVAYIISK